MDKEAVTYPSAQAKALGAVQALGRGYDVTLDLKLGYCKGRPGSCLIKLDEQHLHDIVVPGGFTVSNVSKDITCDKGERTRFRSDVLTFHQMSERFNLGLSINGRIPLGLFNSMFNFKGPWHVDASTTKTLALDGWFVTLYKMQVTKTSLALRDEVKQAVPSVWDPAALASFIEKYGTHIVLSVNIGGKDVIYVRQQQSSRVSPIEIQKYLKKVGDQRFRDPREQSVKALEDDDLSKEKIRGVPTSMNLAQHLQIAKTYHSLSFVSKKDIEVILQRRGGNDFVKGHEEWLTTVSSAPEVISMTFVPIASLLNGVPGSGFLSHAINLYIRCK
ncbi:hypothetical protein O6H91_Y028300 [Diphasiastrum complanatum]|nr:hypothetical protein O6H91_Y028300 [Diphasiastrum complanatum]